MDLSNDAQTPNAVPVMDTSASMNMQSPLPYAIAQEDSAVTKLEVSDWDVAQADWQINTMVGQYLLGRAARDATGADNPNYDENYNPYVFMRQNPELANEFQAELHEGAFNGATSPEEVRARMSTIRQNREARELIARGQGGSLLMNMGMSVFDLPTIASFGALGIGARAGAGLLTRAAYGAVVGAADSAVSESYLLNADVNRTVDEAIMNIGVSSFIGAGAGSLFRHLPAKNAWEPGPNSVFNPETINGPKEIGNGFQSVGAASVHVPDHLGPDDLKDPFSDTAAAKIARGGKLHQFVDNAMAWLNPNGRQTHYDGPGLVALQQVADRGGLLNTGELKLNANGLDAETRVDLYKQTAADTLGHLEAGRAEINAMLGDHWLSRQGDAALSAVTLGRVDRSALPTKAWNDSINAVLEAQYTGHPDVDGDVAAILKAANVPDEMIGKVTAKLKAEAGKVSKFFDDMAQDGVRAGSIEADVYAKTKGNFGHPIKFNRQWWDQNRDEGIAMLIENFQKDPPEELLREMGFVHDGTDAIPGRTTEVRNADGSITTLTHPEQPAVPAVTLEELKADPAKWRQVMEDVSLSVEATANEILQSRRIQAEYDAAQALEDFNDSRQALSTAGKDRRDYSLREARAQARLDQMNIHSRKLALAQGKVDEADQAIADIVGKFPELEQPSTQDILGRLVDQAEAGQEQMRRYGNSISELTDQLSGSRKTIREVDEVLDPLRLDKTTAKVEGRIAESAEEHAAAQAKFAEAQARFTELQTQRRNAVLERDSAMAELNSSSKGQRDAAQYVDQAVKDADNLKTSMATAEQRAGIERVLREDERVMAELRAKLGEAQELLHAARSMEAEARTGVKVTRKLSRQTASELRKARYAEKRGAQRTPLSEWAAKLVDKLAGGSPDAPEMFMDIDPTSGRIQPRKVKWTREFLQRAKAKGAMENDIAFLMQRQATDLGSENALRFAWGGRSRTEVDRLAEEHYQSKISGAKTQAERNRWLRIREANKADLNAVVNRLKGRNMDLDNDVLSWTAQKFGQSALLRYASTFILGGGGDMATGVFAARGFGRQFVKFGKVTREILEHAKDNVGVAELDQLMESLETAQFMALSDRAYGKGSGAQHLGIGEGRTKVVTGAVDKYMGMTATGLSRVSGLAAWSNATRRAASQVQLMNIFKWTKNYDSTAMKFKHDLVAHGIGEREAREIGRLMKEHATFLPSGMVVPNFYKWGETAVGREMRDVVRGALLKTQKRASPTTFIGNQPRLMDRWYGALFFQFQSYAQNITNNFLRAGIQRGAVTDDHLKFYAALGVLMAGGVVSVELNRIKREKAGVREQMDEKQYIYAVIQRSGVLGVMSSYGDIAARFVPGLTSGVSKFSQNSAFSNAIGPAYSQAENVSTLMATVLRGEGGEAGKKLVNMLPGKGLADFLLHVGGVETQ
jgi:hypothetical protein